MPDAAAVVIDYLKPRVIEVAGRVAVIVPEDPVWPMLRVDALSTVTFARRRLDRVLLQVDCFAVGPAAARRLGAEVRAALMELDNYQHPSAAVAVSGDDWGQRLDADDLFTPAVWRAAVTGHLLVRPDP